MSFMNDDDIAELAAFWGVPVPASGPASRALARSRGASLPPNTYLRVRLSARPVGGGFTRVLVTYHRTVFTLQAEIEARRAARDGGYIISNLVTLDIELFEGKPKE